MKRRMTLTSLRLVIATAMSLATPAAAHELSIGVNIGVTPPPPVVVTAPPPLVVVPGTPVYYAPAGPADYFFYGGHYYTFHGGAWFSARAYNGPWISIAVGQLPPPILAVPVTYYKNPPGHWKKGGRPPWAGHGKKAKWKKKWKHGYD